MRCDLLIAQKDKSTAGTDMTCQILFDKFLDVSAVLRACCASVHSFLVWVCLGLSHEGCPSFSELVKENA
ncbi:hypothetical protein PAPYR_10679 [Paratrimastix pyriformis]|uniref:Uncharacterized protein n=1 Tax=Paratrimastix pyriformis TaxID=342808 RepID=A0ABQ8UCK5_9EUKA|nr:hypothetical protein PAPYR_10679 [Paratrimastix pyriformis]